MSKLYFSGISLSNIIRFISIPLIPLILTACAVDEEDTSPLRVRSVATVLGLTGDPTTDRILPDINDPKAQLGKKLFFTKGLGGDEDTACVSCHHPVLRGGDGLSLPIGVGAIEPDLLGPGRLHPSGGPTVPRNAPTTFNTGLIDQTMFLDGRVESIGKTVGLNGNDGLGIVTPDSVTDADGLPLRD